MVASSGGFEGGDLPPAALSRLERARRSGVRSSLLSVDAQIGLGAAGFVFVGEVMGCVVAHLGWQGYVGCGWYGAFGVPAAVTTQIATPGSTAAFAPYVDALDSSWRLALERMLEECRAIGGDGVVGVRLEERRLDSGAREFVALGTAVTARGSVHPGRPFATALSGTQVAKLLANGWVPAGVVVAIAAGIRHDDLRTRQAAMWTAGNVEVPGYSDLVARVREATRRLLSRRLSAIGADGAVLTGPWTLDVHALEVGEGHVDHAAVSSLVATALCAFAPRHLGVAPASLMILPLSNQERR